MSKVKKQKVQSGLVKIALHGLSGELKSQTEAKLASALQTLERGTTVKSPDLILSRLTRFVGEHADAAMDEDTQEAAVAVCGAFARAVGSWMAGNCDDPDITSQDVRSKLRPILEGLTTADEDGHVSSFARQATKLIENAVCEGLEAGRKKPWQLPAAKQEVANLKPPASFLLEGPAYEHVAGSRPIKDSLVNVGNFADYLKLDLWFDAFAQRPMVTIGKEPSVEITDPVLQKLLWQAHRTDFLVRMDTLATGLFAIARRNQRHPVIDYWNTLKWDGKERISTWLSDYCGASNTPLNRAYARKFLIGAVRRVKQPGYLVRHVLVLEGPQRIGKSQALRALAINNNWFTDALEIGGDSKTTIEQAAGKLIVELAELSGMARRDVERVKADISKQSDRARLAYGRMATEVPRQFVMAATTNSERYLKDLSGNTRFWAVRVGEKTPIDLDGLRTVVPQLWAEAVVAADTGEEIYLSDELDEKQRRSAARREEIDPLMETWMGYFQSIGKQTSFVSTDTLWRRAGLEDGRRTVRHQQLMGAAAQRAGWEGARQTNRRGERERGYVRKTLH